MELLEWIESNKSKKKKSLTEARYFDACFVGVICLITLFFGIIYVLSSKTVYFWDDATYWDIGRMLAKKPLNFEFFKEIYNSIGTSDYNYVAALPVSLWMKVFGVTRVSYIAAVILFYVIPTELLIYGFAKRVSKAPKLACAVTLCAIPSFLYIAVIGFIDVAGVLVGLGCYYLYFTDSIKNRPYSKSVLLGIMLVLIMILRRYFAFFAVSFVTAMAIDTILFKRNYKEFATTIITISVLLAVCFYPFLTNILLKDYGALYAGYKYSFFTDLKLITRYFGLMFLVAVFAAVPMSVVKRKEFRSAFALLQVLVCASMFISTQTHGQQHLLLYVPALVVLVIFAINSIDKKWMFALLCAITLFNAISPAINRVQPQNIQEIKSLAMFPNYSIKPEKRSDIKEVLALKRNLDKRIPEGKKCGVLASSFVINSSILTNVVPSLNMKEAREDNYIVGLPEVDSRDFWRLNEIYDCDYILVAYPAQTHLAPKQQTIITEGVKSFVNNTDIAQSFSEISGFKSKIGEVDIKLYKKIKTVSETEKTEFGLKLFK